MSRQSVPVAGAANWKVTPLVTPATAALIAPVEPVPAALLTVTVWKGLNPPPTVKKVFSVVGEPRAASRCRTEPQRGLCHSRRCRHYWHSP